MSDSSENVPARTKFPKFTKKRATDPTPSDVNGVETPHSNASTFPLTPLPESPAKTPDTAPTRMPSGGPMVYQLQRTHFGTVPAVCGPWDGKVASNGPLSGFVITSPTQVYVPQMPKDGDIIKTFVDGRWGVREYSRHPQWYEQEMTHVACIPRHPSTPTVPDILFETLRAEEHWVEDSSVAVKGLGRIRSQVRVDLQSTANVVIDGTLPLVTQEGKIMRYRNFLVMLLRQVITRMTYLPAVATRSIAIAAHVQRLSLELIGLKTYLEVVIPRIESHVDFSQSVLDVVGGFLREGAVTQTWHRVGIPYWVLQPLTKYIVVYKVVGEDPLPYNLAAAPCDPPILHQAGALIGVTNLTGNWISNMVTSMSKHVAGSHLSALDLAAVPDVRVGGESSSKRARLEAREIESRHLTMRPAECDIGQSKAAHRRKRRQGGDCVQQDQASGSLRQMPKGPDAGKDATEVHHPARTFLLSPYIEVSEIWAEALKDVCPLPQTPNSALYFFPPPFLLDTIAAETDVPVGCPYPDRGRVDTKIHRYLHNLLRIREFCRMRLFDISLDNRPLSITQWRAALWGDYRPQTSIRSGGQGSEAQRAKRHLEERNGVGALFIQVAHMNAYSADAIVRYEDRDFDLRTISTDVALRQSLLWESHEVNFRAELLALDTALVHKNDWQEINRWEREMLVSGVWGPPSSGATVVADTRKDARAFCWHSPPHELWETSRDRLSHFALVLTRWPGCPELVIHAGKCGPEDADSFVEVQRQAVRFYVRTFVSHYARLPIPPVASVSM